MKIIKDYIDFQKLAKRAYSTKDVKKRLLLFTQFFNGKYVNPKEFEKTQIENLIKSCLRNELTLDQVDEIPWDMPGKDQIILKVSAHFEEQETLRILNRIQKKEDLFKRICEEFYDDGFLTESEKKELDLEANLLEIDEADKIKIIKEVQSEKELAKPKEVIFEIVESLDNNENFSSDDVYSICKSSKYNLDFEKNEVKRILTEKLTSKITFISEKNMFSLIEIDSNVAESKLFDYGTTSYTYQISKLDPDHAYITPDVYPSKNKCVLIINSCSHYFENIDLSDNLRNLIYDGILIHRIQKIRAALQDGDITKIKTDIHKKLRDIKF